MNKLLTILLLSFVTTKASAQLNTFESGQTIRADEMNENFSKLEEDIASLIAKQNPPPVPCAASSVEGRWITALVWDNDREFISFIFDSGNRVVYYSVTEAFGEVEVIGPITSNVHRHVITITQVEITAVVDASLTAINRIFKRGRDVVITI